MDGRHLSVIVRFRIGAKVRLIPTPLTAVVDERTFSYRTSTGLDRMSSLLQGTLDLLILRALSLQDMHGLGVARRVQQITNGTFVVKPGSLFPALHRLEEAGWLSSTWGTSDNNRRAKFYRLTRAGRQQLERETGEWEKISYAITSALHAT
jgi:transcriptional regulator